MGDHDTLFKRVFGVPEHAAAELRSVLPGSVADRLDLGALAIVPSTFVDAEMRHRHADLLFRAPLVGSSGSGSAYVYFLLEHQSEPDVLMPWRVLGYIQRIWDASLRAEPERKSLPAVITIVVHHGERGWTAPRRLHDLVEGMAAMPELSRYVPDMELLIDDLSTLDDRAIQLRPLRPLPKVTLWLLRDSRNAVAFLDHLAAWGRELEGLVREDPGREDVLVILRYIVRVSGDVPFEVLRQRLVEAAPGVEESMATYDEQLIEKGREQGLQQGREQGLQQGRAAALREVLARQLAARFGDVDGAVTNRIQAAGTAELERWLERVVTAPSIEQLFDG